MNIILFSTTRKRAGSINLSRPRVWVTSLVLLAGTMALVFSAGYRAGRDGGGMVEMDLTAVWEREIDAQREELAAARQQLGRDVDALALRIGQLQAKVIRLDALGQRMVEMAGVDGSEFSFGETPAQGGPAPAEQVSVQVPDLMQTLDRFSAQLDDRERQLDALQSLMTNRSVGEQVRPAGRPVNKGWLSSYYGWRTDPFSGKRDFHGGVDFAGKMGADVVAVAAGVVTAAEERSGYGNLIEITHGNGYVTRYGHNRRNLVKVGDVVKPGQVIAEMGSSGRSTGPHVHFEVLRHGKSVNPSRFVKADRQTG